MKRKIGKTICHVSEEGILRTLGMTARYLLSTSKPYRKWPKRTYVARRFGSVSSDRRIVEIDPADVSYYLIEGTRYARDHRDVKPIGDRHELEKAYFDPYVFRGTLLPGQWDRHRKEYKTDRVYQGVKSHFEDGVSWEETTYAKHLEVCDTINPKRRQSSSRELYENLIELYRDLRDNGYRTDGERYDLVSVNVGRDNELIFNNVGHHRLAVSRVLGMDSIPVLITAIHPDADIDAPKRLG